MGSFLGPKCFLSTAFFVITIIFIYGIVGAVYNNMQSSQRHDIGDWPFNIGPLFEAFTVIQCLFPLVGLFALFAACKKNPLFLYGSGSVLLAIFTCSSIFGLVSYRVAPKDILESIYKTFRKSSNDTKILDWMNEIQGQHRCCGVYRYDDWYATDISVPPSCCRQDIPQNKNCDTANISSNGKATGPKNSPTAKIYLKGCGPILTNMTRQSLEQLSLEMCLCGMLSLFVAIFLYVGVTRFFLAATTPNSSSPETPDQPTIISRKRSHSKMGDDEDENNNSLSGKQQRRLANWRQKRQSRGPFAPIHSQGMAWSSSLRRDISKSKSFIIGDAPSHCLTPIFEEKDPELLRKNVDMLYYQSLDKNMSTLSTTPNDISSMLLPPMNSQSKRQGQGNESPATLTEDEAFALRNTVYTIVGERPFTTSLSQNCSSSFFNGNQMKQQTNNGEAVPTGQCSPGLGNKPRITQKMLSLAADEISEEIQQAVERTESSNSATTEPFNVDTEPTGQTTEQPGNDESAGLTSLVNNVTQNCKYPTTTSVRSSTLATIQEESESAKGSPVNTKAASPAQGCLTPENVSPQQTQTQLYPNSDKDDNAIHCALELSRANNNDIHLKLHEPNMPPPPTECDVD